MAAKPPPSKFTPIAVTVADASRATGIPVSELYELMRTGVLGYAVRASGRGRLIKWAALEAYIRSLEQVPGDF